MSIDDDLFIHYVFNLHYEHDMRYNHNEDLGYELDRRYALNTPYVFLLRKGYVFMVVRVMCPSFRCAASNTAANGRRMDEHCFDGNRLDMNTQGEALAVSVDTRQVGIEWYIYPFDVLSS